MVEDQNQFLYLSIKQGDENAFNQVFNLYYTRLCFFGDHLVHDFDLSRSIVQDVFVDIWLNREKLDIHFSLKSFLFQSVRNKALNVLKHRKVESKFIAEQKKKDEPFSVQDLMEEAELNDKINSAIHELPPKCKEIFLLCRFEELRYWEIAERLNISVKTVEMQISIALKKIRQKLIDPQMLQLIIFMFSKKR
ncbi:MAG: RNA polymerase sigma-70 factor [Prolixibacteraceae bacterium]